MKPFKFLGIAFIAFTLAYFLRTQNTKFVLAQNQKLFSLNTADEESNSIKNQITHNKTNYTDSQKIEEIIQSETGTTLYQTLFDKKFIENFNQLTLKASLERLNRPLSRTKNLKYNDPADADIIDRLGILKALDKVARSNSFQNDKEMLKTTSEFYKSFVLDTKNNKLLRRQALRNIASTSASFDSENSRENFVSKIDLSLIEASLLSEDEWLQRVLKNAQ